MPQRWNDREGRFDVLVRTRGEYQNMEEIRSLVIATRGGVPVYLRDVASVEDSHEEIQDMVSVNGQPAKASRELRSGDLVELRQGNVPRAVVVRALSEVRGPAPVAQALYEETAESRAERERLAQARRAGVEPALAIEQGRPTKRDRRKLADWDRWSASADDD